MSAPFIPPFLYEKLFWGRRELTTGDDRQLLKVQEGLTIALKEKIENSIPQTLYL